MREFFETFIPLFVAIDAFGMVPIFLAVTHDVTPQRRRDVTYQAVGAGLVIALAFMFLGPSLFRFIGITEADFRIAGGIILLVWAVVDLLITGKPAVHEEELVGIVPLAMPLIAGPATLATTIVLASRHGYALTALSLSINLAILLVAMLAAPKIARLAGLAVLRAFSKLIMVLLAALGVSFIASGIVSRMQQ